MQLTRAVAVLPPLAVLLAACGGGGSSTVFSTGAGPVATTSAAPVPAATTAAALATTAEPVGALSSEAASAASGDIPDNQVFLTFDDPAAGWRMKYPEGWAQTGTGRDVMFRDKNNLVRVAIRDGAAPSPASVQADLAALASSDPSLRAQHAAAVTVKGTPMVRAVYRVDSAPNPVTGKQVNLVVDRYVFAKNGHVAVVDLGTPEGVDNVDAYRLMIESFRWQ